MKAVVPEARWDESRQYWKVNVQKNGTRKSFYEKTPGRKGKRICESKAEEWVESNCPTDLRLDVAWAKFLESKKGHVADSTIVDAERMGRLHILPYLGKRKLSTITQQDWQDQIDRMAKNGSTHATCVDLRAKITNFATFARKARLPIEHLTDLEIPKYTERSHRTCLQPHELKVLFSSSETSLWGVRHEDHYIHAYRFTVLTGLRRGEMCGLRWEDFNEDLTVVSVRRSLKESQEFTTGKNDNARRTIYLPERATEELKAQKAMLLSKGLISPWVFPAESGSLIKPLTLLNRWHLYCDANGLPRYVFHELRHTAVSMYGSDVPEKLLKAAIGHSDNMDTQGVYGHRFGDEGQRAAAAMDSVIERVLG